MTESIGKYEGEPKKKLTLKQDKFCKNYATTVEFFGNGTQAYGNAYGIKMTSELKVNCVKVCASRLLKNENICARIGELLEEAGYNDENVRKQHLFLINQFVDLKTKGKMIDSYNRMKGKEEEEGKTTVIFQVGSEGEIKDAKIRISRRKKKTIIP